MVYLFCNEKTGYIKKENVMKRLVTILGTACFLGTLLLAGGCGGGGGASSPPPTPAPVSTSAAVSGATLNTNGTATTSTTTTTVVSAPASAPAAVASVAVSLPPSTTITAQDVSGNVVPLTSAPTFTFSAPGNATTASSGTSSVPLPLTGGFTAVRSTAVAVNVEITGFKKATFSNPITITLPVPGKAAGTVISQIYQNKDDGNGYSLLGGPFTVSANGTIDITVSNLCWFIGDPEFETETGSTGSSGGSFR